MMRNSNSTKHHTVAAALAMASLGLADNVNAEPADAQGSQLAPSATQDTVPTAVPWRPKALRLEMGGRAGYAMPMGKLSANSELTDLASAAIPLQFDAWLRLRGGSALGVYVQFAPGLRGQALEDCDDCSVSNLRAGFQYAYHLNERGGIDPWIGLGAGFERLHLSRETTLVGTNSSGELVEVDGRVTSSFDASPELMVQAGIDLGTPDLAFGPFVSAHYAVYTEQESELKCDGIACPSTTLANEQSEIPSSAQASHLWLLFGLRGTYLR